MLAQGVEEPDFYVHHRLLIGRTQVSACAGHCWAAEDRHGTFFFSRGSANQHVWYRYCRQVWGPRNSLQCFVQDVQGAATTSALCPMNSSKRPNLAGYFNGCAMRIVEVWAVSEDAKNEYDFLLLRASSWHRLSKALATFIIASVRTLSWSTRRVWRPGLSKSNPALLKVDCFLISVQLVWAAVWPSSSFENFVLSLPFSFRARNPQIRTSLPHHIRTQLLSFLPNGTSRIFESLRVRNWTPAASFQESLIEPPFPEAFKTL